MTQFSLFGAEAAPPTLDDLDGVLVAGGQWVRSPAGARLSVLVASRWRADALAEAFAERGVGGADAVIATGSGFAVRTVFTDDLVAPATRWTRGANVAVPPGFQLRPGGLRLWAVAAGRRDDVGYLLATPEREDAMHRIAGAQLSRLGIAAVALTQRGGPGWRVTSERRLRRLVELLGSPPAGGESGWPSTPSSTGRPTVPPLAKD